MTSNEPMAQDVQVPPAASEEHDRRVQPVDVEEAPRLPFPIVGVGASAGGLEAFLAFFAAMKPDPGMAFVLVQHLAPDRENMLVELLARRVSLPVSQVEDGVKVEVNHVYVIRPGHTLTLDGGVFRLGESVERRGHGRPVDDFFRSLAEQQRERAICVIMSGMGSNGTAGAQMVKAVGGLCIAQDPETAQFPSMPRHLVESGYADFVLPPAEIPELLARYAAHPYARGWRERPEDDDEHRWVGEILALLRARTRQDFGRYKKRTILRRIQRRMGVHEIADFAEYLQVLRKLPGEAAALADDLLIHVTGFFRDADAWDSLRERVVLPMIAEKKSGDFIRCWVTACSTGEEAFSLAILLSEVAEQAGKQFDIKIFATDMAAASLQHARAGIYPGGIESEISPERLERYFVHDDGMYRVKKELRELVVFAPQNVLRDPPFGRLDLCSCRNLLIYLEPEMQQQLLSMLHFALGPGGALFLGSSETTTGVEELFETLDKRWRIFRRLGTASRRVPAFAVSPVGMTRDRAPALPRAGTAPPVAELTAIALLARFAPAAVVVDRDLRIVFFYGDTDKFLGQPTGEPTRELMLMARDHVRGALQVLLHTAQAAPGRAARLHDGVLGEGTARCRVWLSAAPLDEKLAPDLTLVSFELVPELADQTETNDAEAPSQLVEDLRRAREELHVAVEELQGSNEELRAANEESSSVNEELQSTNEELETSKEEMQSLNEELTTVNAQLEAKVEEHEATSNDLSSLLSSTHIAVIFLDTQFRIRRYTPAVRDLLELIPSDVGRPLVDLARKFDDAAIASDAANVLATLVPAEREVASTSGRWYVRRILPYRTLDNRIAGVVVTFLDITARKQSEEALREREVQLHLLVESARDYAMLTLDPAGNITTWNIGAARVFGYAESEIVGQHFRLVFTPEDRESQTPEKELATARSEGRADDDRWLLRRDGTRFWGTGVLTAAHGPGGDVRGYVKVLRDGTARKETETNLAHTANRAETASQLKDEFLATMSHELRTPLSAIMMWGRMLKDGSPTSELAASGIDAIVRSAEAQGRLIDDLLDKSRIESGKLRLNTRVLDLAALVSQAVTDILPTAFANGVGLDLAHPDDGAEVLADPERLHQVVANLLSNAVKFTSSGGQVTVELRREGESAVISVKDTGKGIEASLLPRVFDAFRQDDTATTRRHSGLGLGLTISRRLVELHGGSIEAQSDGPERGATFRIVLPLSAYRRPAEAPRTGTARRALDKRHVLLVEDTAETREALVAILTEEGAEVVAVGSAPAAMEAFRARRPDIVLSDLGLPGEDGYSLLRRLRAHETAAAWQRVPAVALSAFVEPEDKAKAVEAGFDRHVSKPSTPRDVVDALQTALAGMPDAAP